MKKLLMLLFMLCSAQYSHAMFKGFYEWRSTSTCSPSISNVLIATGPVFLYDVLVTSGMPLSQFTYSNSSTTSNSDVFRSTSAVYDSSITGVKFPIETTLTNGFLISKSGGACVRFRWDWYITPLSFETTGQHRP